MKKLFTPLLMLAALLASTQVWAQKLTIGGINVNTSASSVQTITGSGISGTVQYNPSNKRLYLKSATISTDDTGWGLFNEIADLTIELYGSNTITSTDGYATFYSRENINIVSTSGQTGSLYVKNTASSLSMGTMFFEENKKLYVTAARLDVTADNGTALYGYKNNGSIIANYCWLHFKGSTYAVRGIKSYYPSSNGIDNTVIHTSGVSFSSSNYGFVDSSSNLVKEVNCYPALILNGIAINASSTYTFTNGSDRGIGVTRGTVTYSSSTKTLEFQNATMNCGSSAIISRLPGLIIKSSTGDNTINSGSIAMDLYNSTTITGDKYLNVSGTYGVFLNSRWTAPLTINVNNTVRFTGTRYRGVYSNSYSNDLILKKADTGSDYFFTGGTYNDTNYETIQGVGHVTLDGMDYYTTGCYYDESSHVVKKTGGEVLKNTTVNIYRFTEEYNLYVAGKKLNNINARGLGSPYLTAGTVKYDNSTKTLTLDGATIAGQPSEAATANCAIYSTVSDLTINATGTNNWTTGFICLNLGGGGTNTIKGSGALNITSNDNAAINVWNTTNLTLARTSGKTALKGKYGFSGTAGAALAINKDGSNGGYYTFSGANGHIVSTPTLNLGTGVRIATSYHWFNPEEKAVYYKNDLASASGNTLWIRGDVTWTDYPISIAGSQLYGETGTGSGNIYGFWNKYVKGGAITYNPSTKTLTLNGATIESVGSHGIEMKLEGNIKLVGTNSLSAKTTTNSKYSAICANKVNITITGDGSLNATSDKNCGIHAHESIVTITDNVKIDATGDCGGLGSILSDYAGTFIISGNAQVKSNKITNVASLTLEDGQTIVEPFKAAFNSSNKRVEVNGAVAQNVVIQKVEKYDLAVCDVDVNSYNKDDILRDGGSFKYDPNMKRLTITDADIDDASVVEGIYNKGIEGLNIAINGDNQINVYEDIFKLARSTTFSGSGTVKSELTSSSGYGIYLAAANVIGNLNGPKFEFTGRRGVGDNGNSNTNLIIEKGCMVFNPNSSSASILNIQNLTLGSGMIIAKPQGGTFDSSKKGIVVNGSLYNGHAVISQKGDVNVDGSVTIADAVAVLNAMAGQEVAGDPDVNGDKEVSIADFVAVLNIMAGQ